MILPDHVIINGDCLNILPKLPKATCVFADIFDNIGMKYNGYKDKLPIDNYYKFLFTSCYLCTENAPIVWYSINNIHLIKTLKWLDNNPCTFNKEIRTFIWHYSFAQHRKTDCCNSFRPIIRIKNNNAIIYPDSIRVPSERQLKYRDKRANKEGRVPGDVWEFPRVCGTFKEKKKWHITQHPEALIERIVKLSTKEGDLVIDPFIGSGTTMRVCQKINRKCIGIDISPDYCKNISTGLQIKLLTEKDI